MAGVVHLEGRPQPMPRLAAQAIARYVEIGIVLGAARRRSGLIEEDYFRGEERHATRPVQPSERHRAGNSEVLAEAPLVVVPLVEEDFQRVRSAPIPASVDLMDG